jgi:hypothetical protein
MVTKKSALLERFRRRHATRTSPRASIPQEKPPARRGNRSRTQIRSRRLKRNIPPRSPNRRGNARPIRLRPIPGDGNELRRWSTPGRRSRARIAQENIHQGVRIAIHQIPRRRKKHHVPPVLADRRREAVAIGKISAQARGNQRLGRNAAGWRARARIAHKNILRRSRNFRRAVRRSHHMNRVATVRTHQMQGQQDSRAA